MDPGNNETVYDFGAGLSLIHVAAHYSNDMAIRELLRRGLSPDTSTDIFCTPLHFAARMGNTDTVKELLRLRAHPDYKTVYSWSPLHFAAKYGHEECLDLLWRHGADVNPSTRVEDGAMTPLHLLAERGHVNGMSVLAPSGVELKKYNSKGETAYELLGNDSNLRSMRTYLLRLEARIKDRPQLWFVKDRMSVIAAGDYDYWSVNYFYSRPHQKGKNTASGLAARYELERGTAINDFMNEMSSSISNGTFNHHDVIYARHLIKFGKEKIEGLSEDLQSAMELLIFLLQQTFTPGDAPFRAIGNSEYANTPLSSEQPPNTPDEV